MANGDDYEPISISISAACGINQFHFLFDVDRYRIFMYTFVPEFEFSRHYFQTEWFDLADALAAA